MWLVIYCGNVKNKIKKYCGNAKKRGKKQMAQVFKREIYNDML